MTRDTYPRHGQWLMLALILLFITSIAQAQTTTFTYQGKLNDGGTPASGPYDLEFKVFDALTGGAQAGATVTQSDVQVTGGIFSVLLNFGAGVFTGADRWLEISVRPGASTGAYTTLTPRQALTPTPYAIRSQSAAAADTATNATNAANATNAVNATNAANATTAGTATNFTGALAGDVTGTQGAITVARLRGQTVANTVPSGGQVLKFNSTTNQWEPAADANAGGTITGVTAGTGLSGGGTSGNVTLSLNIPAGAVGATELAANAVTSARLADGSVTTSKIVDANVTAAKLADGSVATAKIVDGNVTSTKLADGSVSSAKLADGNVITAKLADLSVTNAKINDVAGGKITGSITVATIPGANVGSAVANATNATTATNFSGALAGDVTGTQSATNVGRLQGRTVASTAPSSGQVLKYNGSQWEPGTDSTGSVSAPLSLSASNAGPIIAGTNTGAGAGIAGTGATGSGVHGMSTSANGVRGEIGGLTGRLDVAGVFGYSGKPNGTGILGESNNGTDSYGVWGLSNTGRGVVGENTNTIRLGSSPGVYGGGFAEDGVWAVSVTGNGIYASGGDYAAYLAGKVYIGGPLEKPSGSFKIDHPLDPENKYLYHSFVESPDMKNIYDGVATLGEDGTATVELPEWFGALNRDFRYQLTAIGAPASGLHIAEKLGKNRFKIAGGSPGLEVSWQVTGIRQDAYANRNRIQVEVEKGPKDRGTYLHPEAFDQPAEKGADWKRRATPNQPGKRQGN